MHTRAVSGSVLLERERELGELAAAARDAAAGNGALVLILGEAGIGKSSLVRALRELLPVPGRVLVGHCDDLGTPRSEGMALAQAVRYALAPHPGPVPGRDEARVAG
jgi:predicted ATPase